MIDPDLSLLDTLLSLLLPQIAQAVGSIPAETLRRTYANGRVRLEVLLSADGHQEAPRPSWDGRVLRLGDRELHAYRMPAHQQTRLLDAFEGSSWAHRLANPFRDEGSGHPDPKVLSDTISAINKVLPPHSLRFHGDGTGDVCWSLT